ncbi:MAG: hypothetical protein N2Z74_01590, partial [Syntrophales bacterium]|nr:hypothetical protein [Syntrophales bacterium]
DLHIDVKSGPRLSLAPLMKPVVIPLFRPYPLSLADRQLYLRLQDVTIQVEADSLLIKAMVSFAKTPGLTL